MILQRTATIPSTGVFVRVCAVVCYTTLVVHWADHRIKWNEKWKRTRISNPKMQLKTNEKKKQQCKQMVQWPSKHQVLQMQRAQCTCTHQNIGHRMHRLEAVCSTKRSYACTRTSHSNNHFFTEYRAVQRQTVQPSLARARVHYLVRMCTHRDPFALNFPWFTLDTFRNKKKKFQIFWPNWKTVGWSVANTHAYTANSQINDIIAKQSTLISK